MTHADELRAERQALQARIALLRAVRSRALRDAASAYDEIEAAVARVSWLTDQIKESANA